MHPSISLSLLLIALLPMPGPAAAEDDPLPDGARARLGSHRLRHQALIVALTFSPDGTKLASVSNDRVLQVWETASGKQVCSLTPEAQPATFLRFSPDGKLLATVHGDCDARIWDAATGKPHPPGLLVGAGGGCLTWSPDGKMLACGGRDGRIRQWNVATGKAEQTMIGHTAAVLALGYAPSGGQLYSYADDLTLRHWMSKTGQQSKQIKVTGAGNRRRSLMHHLATWGMPNDQARRDSNWVRSLTPNTFAFSPDGKLLASGGGGAGWDLWSVEDGVRTREAVPHRGEHVPVLGVSFSGDSRFLATVPASGNLSIWSVAANRELRSVARHEPGQAPFVHALALALSPDARTLASTADGRLLLWDAATTKPLFGDTQATGPVLALIFFDRGRKLATLHSGSILNAWDSGTGEHLDRLPAGFDSNASVEAVPDGKAVRVSASSSPSKWIEWQPKGRLDKRDYLAAWKRPISPDGRTILLADSRGFRLHDLESSKDLRPVTAPPPLKASIVFSPDGQRFVAPTEQSALGIWEVSTGKLAASFAPPPGGPELFASPILLPEGHLRVQQMSAPPILSRGGRLLVQLSSTTLRVWEAASGQERLQMPLAGTNVNGVFSPDGRAIVLGLPSGEAVGIDLGTGKEFVRRKAHRGPIRCLRFSADGKLLATGSEDTTTLIWDEAAWRAPRRQAEKPAAELLESWWGDLSLEDARKAFMAIRGLGDAPAESAAFLKAKLELISGDPVKRIGKLIADLDTRNFRARDHAMKALAEIGPEAKEALENALKNKPALEAKQRIEKLLQQIQSRPQEGRLRVLRAIEALERAGTPEAYEVLKALTGGSPDAWLTQEAKLAIERR